MLYKVLNVMLHISITVVILFLLYWFVFKDMKDKTDEELRDRIWNIALYTVISICVLMVLSLCVR